MPLVEPYDPATPADVHDLSQGDDRIRELKRALTERLVRVWSNWPNGDPMTWVAGIVPGSALANLSIASAHIIDRNVTSAKIALDAIIQELIADGAVGSDQIANLAVISGKIADLAITTGKIADLAVTDAKIASVAGAKIADNTIATAKYADLSVTTAKIALLAITEALIAAGAVSTDKLADDAVTAAKIADASVSRAMLDAALKGEVAHMKSVDLNVVAGNHGTDTVTSVGTAAMAGAAVGDSVTVGRPNIAAWTHAQRTNRWDAVVSAAGVIELYVINMSGGNKDWPAFTAKLRIVKSFTDWGM